MQGHDRLGVSTAGRSRFWAHVELSRERILNHPGHGSQKSHGRKGGAGPGSGKDLSGDHETLERVYNANIDEDTGGWKETGGPSDEALVGIAREQGFDAKPTVLDSKSFDQAVAEGGHTVMYRGVKGTDDMSAADMHAQVRNGDYEPGLGIFGNGYYMAPKSEKAAPFADGSPGSLGRYALHRDAKTISYSDLRSEYGKYFDSPAYRNAPESTTGMTADFGRFATVRGYDAIHVPAGTPLSGGGKVQNDEYVIVNRGALLADGG